MVKVERVVLGMYQTNTYLLYNEGSKDAVVVDPADSGEYIHSVCEDKGLSVKAILHTHGHFDHIFGANKLKSLSNCNIYAYEDEDALLRDENLNISISVGRPTVLEADVLLRDNETLVLAGMEFKVIHTPGHTQGSCCYYLEKEGILIAGDTLFCLSIGRSDFPTGNGRQLLQSVKDRLFILPSEVKVCPGHGDSSTIGFEKENNPFFT